MSDDRAWRRNTTAQPALSVHTVVSDKSVMQVSVKIDLVHLRCHYFADRDLAGYEADPTAFPTTPVRERLTYYRNNSSEIRFVRHTRPFFC
jgi:hypothetical protein